MTISGQTSTTDTFITQDQIFINGEWVESAGKKRISVENPATESEIGTVIRGTAEDVDRAARAAADAFAGWSTTAIEERARVLRRLANLIETRDEEITRLLVREVGQPIKFTSTAVAVNDLRNFADAVGTVQWEELEEDYVVRREPMGVLRAICAWNSPLRSVCLKAGAAIAAGCTVVCKPSEVAPLSAYIFAEMTLEAGLPDGVFNLVSGTGLEVGEAIAEHPLIDMVSLTGSVAVGARVMQLGRITIASCATGTVRYSKFSSVWLRSRARCLMCG